jgi:hypothetical protein
MKKLLFLYFLFIPRFLFAGTSVIDVRTEGWGTITKTTGQNNLNGAMVWNGTEWVVNNTWAHKYFLDTRTGNRLKDPAVVIIKDVIADEFDTLNYHILRRNYTYSCPARDGGSYAYAGTEFVVDDKTTGHQFVLRSRGTGNGIGKAYFDIYIEDDVTGGAQNITAFRNDPKWFNYPGMTMAQALVQKDTVQNLTGNFPTNKGWYFLDVGGGGDLGPEGIGKSYIFHTDSLPPVPTRLTLPFGIWTPAATFMNWISSQSSSAKPIPHQGHPQSPPTVFPMFIPQWLPCGVRYLLTGAAR